MDQTGLVPNFGAFPILKYIDLGRTKERNWTAMTGSALNQASSLLEPKAVEVLLRGGQSLIGMIHVPEGQPLLGFLGMRKYFLNLTDVRPADATGNETALEHLSVRISNVVWVIPMDETLHMSGASSPLNSHRSVELRLVDAVTLIVSLNIAREQRMTDYMDSNDDFIPLWNARVASSAAEVIERLAVNHTAILAIREMFGDED
jgi:hypothetical protein